MFTPIIWNHWRDASGSLLPYMLQALAPARLLQVRRLYDAPLNSRPLKDAPTLWRRQLWLALALTRLQGTPENCEQKQQIKQCTMKESCSACCMCVHADGSL